MSLGVTLRIPQIFLVITVALVVIAYCFLCILLGYDYFIRPPNYRYKALNIFTYNDDLSKYPSKYEGFSHKYLIFKLGQADARLFALLDRDGNGLISLTEYESLVQAIKPVKHKVYKKIDRNIPSSDIVKLKYIVGQLHTNASWHRPDDCHYSMKYFNQICFSNSSSFKQETFSQKDFSFFDPPKGFDFPGAIYSLIESNSKIDYFLKNIDRGDPGPYFDTREQFLHYLLDPILPRRIFIFPKNGALISYAILRAISKNYVDILFKLQFDIYVRLNGTSFLITPAGLNGRIVLGNTKNKIPYFNVWLERPCTGILIMDAHGGCLGETYFTHLNISLATMETSFYPDLVEYDSEIPIERAWEKLLSTHYPFRIANYFDLTTGLDKFLNNSTKKLSHLVITIGSLMDQSCSEECAVFRENVLSNANVIQLLRYHYLNIWATLSDIKKEFPETNILSRLKNEVLNHLNDSDTFGVALIMDRAGEITRSFPIKQYASLNIHDSPQSDASINEMNEDLVEKYSQFLSISF